MATAAGPCKAVFLCSTEVVWSDGLKSVHNVVGLNARRNGDLVSRMPPVPMIYETTSLLRLVWGRGGFDG